MTNKDTAITNYVILNVNICIKVEYCITDEYKKFLRYEYASFTKAYHITPTTAYDICDRTAKRLHRYYNKLFYKQYRNSGYVVLRTIDYIDVDKATNNVHGIPNMKLPQFD